ncbi:WW domain-binding protein 11-like [Dermacentor silvarum]|uniref:WW domain-binding protein 11-like n=1 Tax=Dermacentor silvarum TaxID=543639 RepID=UPI001899FB2C|nr:WW domain-binding protein 11-like [Dermacentor silvarum]
MPAGLPPRMRGSPPLSDSLRPAHEIPMPGFPGASNGVLPTALPPRVMPQWPQPRGRIPAPHQPFPPPRGHPIPQPTSEEPCEDETTTPKPPSPTKCTTVIGTRCFLDTGEEIVAGSPAGSPPRSRFPPKEGVEGISIVRSMGKPFNVSNAGGKFSDGGGPNAAPSKKIFGGRSFFRGGKSPISVAASNKTFEETAYFQQRPPNERVFDGGSSSKFACLVYGSMVPIILLIAVLGWYQWKDYRRRSHYRLLGSFRDSRHPAYELDPDCDDCDYKSVLQQQQTAVAS